DSVSVVVVLSYTYRIDDSYDIRSANDFLVSQNTASFALDSITADFFYHEATSLDSVSVYFYEDDNDLPGQMIEAYTSVNIVSSDSIYTTNPWLTLAGWVTYTVHRMVFTLPEPVSFSGDNTPGPTKYWIQFVAHSNPNTLVDGLRWVYLGVNVDYTKTIGSYMVHSPDDQSGPPDWSLEEVPKDGIFGIYGHCSAEEGCLPPVDFTLTGSVDSVSLNWEEPGEATEWVVTYGPTGFDPMTGGTVYPVDDGIPEATISGLTPNMDDDFYVSSVCADGDTSAMTAPLHFHTGYCEYFVPPDVLYTNSFRALDTTKYINNLVTTTGLTNIENLDSGYSPGGYLDATALSVSQYAEGDIGYTADFEGGAFAFAIWVDWNKDFIF